MSIGEKIYNLRTKANISQETMGFDLKVSRQAVSKWETNQSIPDLENLKMIANYFNIPLTDLIDENVNKVVSMPEENKKINQIKRTSNILLIICLSLFALIFTSFMSIILLQKPLAKMLKLTVFEEHVFVFPIFEFIGFMLLLSFIILMCVKVLKNKNSSYNIAFEIVSIVLSALITNTYFNLPSLTNIILKNKVHNTSWAISYSSVRYLLNYTQPYIIIAIVIFVSAMSISLVVKSFKNK